jgi:response regulator RpfG family c-di-GMP phosphodiesterase
MQSTVECRIRIDRRFLERAHAELQQVFGVEFDVWGYSGAWSRATASELEDDPDAAFDLQPPLELVPLLDESRENDRPAALAAGADELQLAIPLPPQGPIPIVASATFQDVPQTLLMRFASHFVKTFAEDQQVLRLREENEAFLRHVTNDFEELTFLRNMAELLEVTDLTFDFVAMAKSVLPTLHPIVGADALVLIAASRTAKNSPESRPKVLGPILWEGKRELDDGICTRLVERFRDDCHDQPVVRNNFEAMEDGAKFPGVDSFILVPVVNGDLLDGWILALNRNNDWNLNTADLPWQISYLEFGTHEATLLASTASILATHARNVELYREREQIFVSVVRALVSAMDAKDEYTRGHSERVAIFGKRLAREIGFNDEQCEQLYLAGLLHDIGKIGVSGALLRKPGRLTDEEYQEIQRHPDKGWAILADMDPLAYVMGGMLYHHERFDGRGYPDGLQGHDIPIEGRILAVADAYDAMTSDRPYRKGMPQEKAESILRDGAGKQWDPEMIDAFFRCMPDLVQLRDMYQPRVPAVRKKGTTVKEEAVAVE